MKKRLFILFILLFLSGCGKKTDELVMVTEAGFAPYEYYENDKIVGVDIDIASEIAKSMNKELVVKDIFFDSIINELNSGKADIALAGMSITPERLEEVDFSIEYIKSRQVVIVKNDSDISDINKIYDKKIAVQLGSVADTFVTEKNIEKNIVRQKKYLSMIEDIKASKVDAIIIDELPAKEIIKENDSLKILEGYVFEDSYGIAVKKGNSDLLDKINKVLEELINNGKIDDYVINHTK